MQTTVGKIVTASEFKATAADQAQQARHLALGLIETLRVASYGSEGLNKVTVTSESIQREVLVAAKELLQANGWRVETKSRGDRKRIDDVFTIVPIMELALIAPES